jgi:asparagine synthase (glutamine-hydrolysing)
MPGLAGLLTRRPVDKARLLVSQMTTSMQHETFHVAGTYSVPDLGIFAGWVALEDSLGRYQPLLSQRGDVVVLLAGECLADNDSGAPAGYWRGQRDDRVSWLIELYEKAGDQFFERLNGLFSGLLIDLRRRTVMLFNDRYGMERIYYYEGLDEFYFASEAKALLDILPNTRTFDHEGLGQFLQYGCTLGPTTLFHDIKLLPGGSVWSLNRDGCRKRRYFFPETWQSQQPMTAQDFLSEFKHAFARILPRYLGGDKDIGISLTGGLDTRMIMACRPQTTADLVSYTFAGTSGDTLDVRLAARVAEACQVPHHVLRINADFFADYPLLLDRTVYMTDGCSGACGAHEIYLNNQARKLASTRLTGNFGSEVLRQVSTFKPLGLSPDLLAHDLQKRISEATTPLLTEAAAHPVAFASFREIPWHLFGVFRAAQSQVTMRTPYLDNDIVALAFRAPDRIRRSSSAASRTIREYDTVLSRIPTDAGVIPASQLLSLLSYLPYRVSFKLDYWYGDGMPHWLSRIDAYLSARGFRAWEAGLHKYLHYRSWFRRELSAYISERLTDPQTLRSGYWNQATLRQIVNDHTEGTKNYIREIDAVLTLEAVDRLLFRKAPRKDDISECRPS